MAALAKLIDIPHCTTVGKTNTSHTLVGLGQFALAPGTVLAAMVDGQPKLTTQQLNEELCSLLDKHAPIMRRQVLAGHSAPWYASVKSMSHEKPKAQK